MSTLIRFDGFEVDLAAGRLFKHGSRIRLREQSFQVLAMLLEHPGDVVTREDLRQRLWPTEVFIDFEKQSERGGGPAARGARRLGGAVPLHRDAAEARLSLHRTASESDRQADARSLRRWRPAAGREVPATRGARGEAGRGRVGEVWLARHGG